jgi:hypothetical protein
MSSDPERDRELIEAALSRSRGRGTAFAMLLFGLALLGPIRFVPEGNYALAAVMFAGLSGIAAFIFWHASRSDPSSSPVARLLIERPEAITEIVHFTSSSSGGALKMHWLKIKAHGMSFGFRVDLANLVELARALARHCPNARIEVPGFERPAPIA